MNEFFNDRRPRPSRDGDAATPLDKQSVTQANRHLLESTPEYRKSDAKRRIRTAAVQRFRARQSGRGDFDSIEQYKEFIYGTEE